MLRNNDHGVTVDMKYLALTIIHKAEYGGKNPIISQSSRLSMPGGARRLFTSVPANQ